MNMEPKFQIVSGCPLCEEHSLHNLNDGELGTKQCLNCGFVTSERYKGSIDDNKTYDELPAEMKMWAKEKDGYIWIPSLITLPTGMIYPNKKDDKLEWCVASGDKDENGTITYDTKNPKSYDTFDVAMFMLSKNIENKKNPKLTRILQDPREDNE